MSNVGSAVAWVTTSNATIPIPGAVVTFRRRNESGEVIRTETVTTDFSGKTPPIQFETPPPSESQSPGKDNPFVFVEIDATHPLYIPMTAEGVQIFPNVQTVQMLDTVPLSADGDPKLVIISPEPQTL